MEKAAAAKIIWSLMPHSIFFFFWVADVWLGCLLVNHKVEVTRILQEQRLFKIMI